MCLSRNGRKVSFWGPRFLFSNVHAHLVALLAYRWKPLGPSLDWLSHLGQGPRALRPRPLPSTCQSDNISSLFVDHAFPVLGLSVMVFYLFHFIYIFFAVSVYVSYCSDFTTETRGSLPAHCSKVLHTFRVLMRILLWDIILKMISLFLILHRGKVFKSLVGQFRQYYKLHIRTWFHIY